MNKPKMFLMTGHPGSGKSVFAKNFAKINGYRYLSIDDMYATFNGSPYDHSNKFDVWMTFYRQIHAAEEAGVDIVVDTNAPTVTDRTEFLNWFQNFDHYLIWINTDEELCLKNNQNRERVIPEEQMRNVFLSFEHPTPDELKKMKSRSKWKCLFLINNDNNHFINIGNIGVYPKGVKVYNEEI